MTRDIVRATIVWELLTDPDAPMRRELILGVHRLGLDGT